MSDFKERERLQKENKKLIEIPVVSIKKQKSIEIEIQKSTELTGKKSRTNIIKKLASLSEEKFNLVADFIDGLDFYDDSFNNEEYQSQLIKKWQYLLENNTEFDSEHPLSNDEIDIICQVLSKENQTRTTEIAKEEFTIGDNFDEPLPDEILDLFYQ